MIAGPCRLSLVGIVVVVVSVFLAPSVHAADLQVPAQYPKIQLAIAAAAPGDHVFVQPGTYHETLDFLGKGIEVIGVGGADVTVIDASGLGTTAVLMSHAEPATTALQGFTITGGTGIQSGDYRFGGGLYVGSSSSPTIRECRITGNSVGPNEYSRGGGVAIGQGASPGAVTTVIDCEIFGNESSGTGGGIAVPGDSFFGSHPLIRNCEIHDNVAAGYGGGGCYGTGDFVDCLITGNHTEGYGGGASSVHALTGSVLRANSAGIGGGGYFDYQIYGVGLADCTIIENVAPYGGGAYLRSDSPSPIFGPEALVSGCVFARNDASSSGDGLVIAFTGSPSATSTVSNCSFDSDRFVGAGFITVRNSIFRTAVVGFPASASVTYSDIEGGWPGTGNIDADPLWVDPAGGDYHLQPCSPCINTGAPTSPLDADGTRADMGALPFQTWIDLGGGVPGASGASVLAGTGTLFVGEPMGITLTHAAPSTPLLLVLGTTALGLPFKGGTLWPARDAVVSAFATDAAGTLQLSSAWPPLIPRGFSLCMQAWWVDAGAEAGFAGSNGLRGTSP